MPFSSSSFFMAAPVGTHVRRRLSRRTRAPNPCKSHGPEFERPGVKIFRQFMELTLLSAESAPILPAHQHVEHTQTVSSILVSDIDRQTLPHVVCCLQPQSSRTEHSLDMANQMESAGKYKDPQKSSKRYASAASRSDNHLLIEQHHPAQCK